MTASSAPQTSAARAVIASSTGFMSVGELAMTPNLTRRRLLFQRLLEFLEQPHVLESDNRLVREGF